MGDLTAETKSEIKDAQDQTSKTKHKGAKILKTRDKILTASPVLTKENYVQRHRRCR
jgi:hypothetical protein